MDLKTFQDEVSEKGDVLGATSNQVREVSDAKEFEKEPFEKEIQ